MFRVKLQIVDEMDKIRFEFLILYYCVLLNLETVISRAVFSDVPPDI